MLVAIDAGHGGIDYSKNPPEIVTPGKRHPAFLRLGIGTVSAGPTSRRHLFVEGVWNRYAADKLDEALGAAGIGVVRTYHHWQDWSRTRRAAIATLARADLLVSIHANAGGGEGFECYHNDFEQARNVAEAAAEAYQLHQLGPLRNPAVRPNYPGFGILKRATMPAVLLEAGFFDNERDQARLIAQEWVETYAAAIAAAICSIKP